MSFALVWLASAAVLGVSALLVRQPGYMDAYYYYHVAANLAAGRGLVEGFIWNYLSAPDTIVHASNLYWMPLTSLVAAPFMVMFGESFRSAQIPFVVLGATAPALAYYLGNDIFGDRRYALGMAALTLFSGFYFVYWTAIDSFGLFSLLVNLALIIAYKLMRRLHYGEGQGAASRREIVLLCVAYGALSGGAYLARADGPLLLCVLGVLILGAPRRSAGERLGIFALVAVGFGLVVGPWLARNIAVSGSALPGGALKTLFLTEYNDFFSYGKALNLPDYIRWGWREVLWSKAQALARNPLVLFGIEYYLAPFALIGLWRLRKRLEYRPILVYGVLLYLVMSLVFSFVSGRGSMLHSSVVLLPWLAGAAMYGLDACVTWVARRRAHWRVEVARRNLTVLMVLCALVMSVVLFSLDVGKRDERFDQYNQLADWFARHGQTESAVLIVDPPGFHYSSGQPSLVLPSDGPDAALAVGARYGAGYLVLEKLHSRAYQGLYEGTQTAAGLRLMARLGDMQVYQIVEQSDRGDGR